METLAYVISYYSHNKQLIKQLNKILPSGSGLDNGSEIDVDKTSCEKIVIKTAFHHMNDRGFYDGWNDHVVTIRPRFSGFDVHVSGRNKRDIKDYIHDVFEHAMRQKIDVSVHTDVDGFKTVKFEVIS
jgi:hypothetical protein